MQEKTEVPDREKEAYKCHGERYTASADKNRKKVGKKVL